MQNRPTSTQCRQQEIRSLDGVAPFARGLADELLAAGFTEKDTFCLRLAVEEAIVNAMRHGNCLDPNKKVVVRCSITPLEAVVEVEDEGPGFDPQRLPDPLSPENIEKPSGRGIFLMRFYMTWVKFNDRGNCVTMCRRNSAAGGY